MEPIKPTATLTSKIRVQHEPADGADAASGTIGDLPYHLTERILDCISPLESVRLATICKSWAATISERLARPTPHMFALEVSNEDRHPLLFPRQPEKEHHRRAIFSLPIDEEGSSSPVAPAALALRGPGPKRRYEFIRRLALWPPILRGRSSHCPLEPRHRCVPERDYCHLLESEGSVLFVDPVLAPKEPGCPNTIGGFEVYRLDVKAARWLKVKRLADDRALFLSEQSSFMVRASEVPGCMSNCIYFVDEVDEDSCATWGVYSMEERKLLFQHPVGGSPGKYDAARSFLPVVVNL
uniref:Uncharacterized protein n=1 Tax=Aegilops tauschii TaxID=37682 RepID=M8C032_AEGTA